MRLCYQRCSEASYHIEQSFGSMLLATGLRPKRIAGPKVAGFCTIPEVIARGRGLEVADGNNRRSRGTCGWAANSAPAQLRPEGCATERNGTVRRRPLNHRHHATVTIYTEDPAVERKWDDDIARLRGSVSYSQSIDRKLESQDSTFYHKFAVPVK